MADYHYATFCEMVAGVNTWEVFADRHGGNRLLTPGTLEHVAVVKLARNARGVARTTGSVSAKQSETVFGRTIEVGWYRTRDEARDAIAKWWPVVANDQCTHRDNDQAQCQRGKGHPGDHVNEKGEWS